MQTYEILNARALATTPGYFNRLVAARRRAFDAGTPAPSLRPVLAARLEAIKAEEQSR